MNTFTALFHDRRAAGRVLAKALQPYRTQRPVVLGIARGGVPVLESVSFDLADGAALVSIQDGLDTADVIVMLVDHDAFKVTPSPAREGLHLIDTRGVWTAHAKPVMAA